MIDLYALTSPNVQKIFIMLEECGLPYNQVKVDVWNGEQYKPEFLKVNVHGNVAVASGVLRVKGVEAGKPYTRRERFVDTWLHKGDNWVCIATDATPIVR